jgi:hypothetical protein
MSDTGISKLNLGFGFGKREGFDNADRFAACDSDVLMNMERAPWRSTFRTTAMTG